MFTHHEPPLTPDDLWKAWNIELSIIIPLVVTTLIYLWGLRNAWQRAGAEHGMTRRHYGSFLGALLALIVAFISPLDTLSEVLFSAHMVQHMILILVAAPLLVMSDFPLAFVWALPRGLAQGIGLRWNRSQTLRRMWHVVSNSVFAWLLFTIALWAWHVPTIFEAALQDETLHTVEHLGFLIPALLFWWVLLRPTTQKHLSYGTAIPYLFTTVVQSGILGALMTFTSRPWYSYYTDLVASWGLSPLQDQQLAGLIMWVPGGAVFTFLTIGYFAAWLHILEQRATRIRREYLMRR